MRILYGVVGDGMGHATRSRVVIDHLRARGHQVLVVASGKAAGFLARSGVQVVEIQGFAGHYTDGAVSRGATVLRALRDGPRMLRHNIPLFFGAVRRFDPEFVMTDFESFAHRYALQHGLPVVCLDNQHVLSRCRLDPRAVAGAEFDYRTQRLVIRAKTPGCDHYVVTSFFEPPLRPRYTSSTTFVGPLVRDVVARAEVTTGDHVLVYQSFGTDRAMLDALNRVDARFVVYGMGREETVGNCTLRAFSEEGFVRDLASARAVVCNGGYSLMSECVVLRKPVFSVALRHQFEQLLNARYLQLLGYGECHDRVAPGALGRFLAQAEDYRAALSRRPPDDNTMALDRIDAVITRVSRARGLRAAV